jgi:hypothetical protein
MLPKSDSKRILNGRADFQRFVETADVDCPWPEKLELSRVEILRLVDAGKRCDSQDLRRQLVPWRVAQAKHGRNVPPGLYQIDDDVMLVLHRIAPLRLTWHDFKELQVRSRKNRPFVEAAIQRFAS